MIETLPPNVTEADLVLGIQARQPVLLWLVLDDDAAEVPQGEADRAELIAPDRGVTFLWERATSTDGRVWRFQWADVQTPWTGRNRYAFEPVVSMPGDSIRMIFTLLRDT